MKVVEFNREKGIYAFDFEELETEMHSHPTIEVLFASRGVFQLSTSISSYENLTFALVDANVEHAINGSDLDLHVLMIEHNGGLVKEVLLEFDIEFNEVHISREKVEGNLLLSRLTESVNQGDIGMGYDKRVKAIIDYLIINDLEYQAMSNALVKIVNLSYSRLSHIFRADVGISLKKYLVWCKLKTAIEQHLDKEEDLFSSLINSGFYDQPHFSRAFKEMLGVPPSLAYNSNIVQA